MNRRDFILAFGALPALRGERQVRFRSNPFTLGVASGDPMPGGVVLWTRLARVDQRRVAVDPHIKFFNTRRGYVRATVTPLQWTSDYRVVPYVSRPGASIETRASFVVESGKPGAHS